MRGFPAPQKPSPFLYTATVRLTFFGTRGYVEESSRTHSGHSAILVEANRFRLLCDFGENRKGLLAKIRPDAIFVSHAHPDHGWGLWEGTDLPVYASAVTHEILKELPLLNRVVVAPREEVAIGPFRLAAHPTIHSVRCPAVGARLALDGFTFVYSADIVAFEDPDAALAGADFYLGDGSTLTDSLVRRHQSGVLIGHTTVRAQLGWLARHGIVRAAFSHFGRGPIEMGDEALRATVAKLAAANPPGCAVTVAEDGLEIEIGP